MTRRQFQRPTETITLLDLYESAREAERHALMADLRLVFALVVVVMAIAALVSLGAVL